MLGALSKHGIMFAPMQHVARICFVNSCNCLKIANNPCVWHSNFYKLPKKCFLLLYYYANNINNITKGIDKWHPLLLYITQVLVRLLWSPFEYSSNWYLCRCTHTVSLSLSLSLVQTTHIPRTSTHVLKEIFGTDAWRTGCPVHRICSTDTCNLF